MSDRYLAVHFPAFRLERCGYDPRDVAVLIGLERSAMRVLALTPAASELGLHRGMTVSEARSVEPSVEVELWDPAGELTDRSALLRAWSRISDAVQAMGEQDLVLEVSRTARTFGGEEGVVRAARELAASLGHAVGVAITDDPRAAVALARRPGNPIVPVGGMREALAMLPVHALDPPEGLLASLRALGIRTLGELAALDAASVAGRFGADGVRLHRLACGGRPPRDEAEVAWVEDELPGVSTPLAGATTTLQLHFVLPGLLQQLARALSDLGLAAVQLRCTLELDDGTFAGFGVRVGRPTRDVATLEHLVRTRLATVKLEAPVEAWRIEVQEAVPSAGWQPGLTDRTEAREPLPDVLARLIDALGEEAVFSAEPVDAWCPERAWRPVPFALRPPLRRPPPAPDDVVDRQERWDHALTWARPASLLESPVLIEVQGSPPARLRLPTGWLAVETATGPEVLSGSWWQPEAAWDREYWVVRLTGGRTAWIYAAEHHWWLHGWF